MPRQRKLNLPPHQLRPHLTIHHKTLKDTIIGLESVGGTYLQRYMIAALEEFCESQKGRDLARAFGVSVNYPSPPPTNAGHPPYLPPETPPLVEKKDEEEKPTNDATKPLNLDLLMARVASGG